jgi:small GTP-binding protein
VSVVNESGNTAIVLTLTGAAAIAVIRLRGVRVRGFLEKCFNKKARVGECVHGELRDGGVVLDDPVVVAGDDLAWADLSVHGGEWVVRSVLDLTRREGFRLVEATVPLAEEALEGASILEREVETWLPLARTEEGIRMLLAQPGNWERGLREGLDAEEVLGDWSLWWMLNPPEVAIVGEPNVGKSTLANQLFGRKRSITADVAGTTRDWVGDFANVNGLAVALIDTPGRRETEDEIERAAILASAEKVAGSDLKIWVLDATSAPKEVPSEGMIVINKVDCVAGWDFSAVDAIRISAKTGEGMDRLRGGICDYFGVGKRGENAPRWWTERQRTILERAQGDRDALREFALASAATEKR